MYTYRPEDIVALATPRGVGALAVIRISGADLSSTYKILSHKKPLDRRAVFSKIFHPDNNKMLDESVITYFKSPNSYTGEDVIEISCHGGGVVADAIIKAAIVCGARLAQPGEFSMRAFLNGKIDLVQAEAIATLITSRTQLSADVSLFHLQGGTSEKLAEIKQLSTNMLAIIEHELNFSEDEINFTTHEEIRKQISSIKLKIHEIIKSSVFGRYIHSGVRVVLIGKPNSGKSSLFNSILGHERAIVSDEPGTTRDTIEAWIELAGLSVCLVDTAGVWESESVLEKLGIEKTFEELKRADLFILIDDEDPSCLLNYQFSKDFNNKYILVKSKCDDLSSENINGSRVLHTSSLKSKGIDILLTHLSTFISNHVDKNAGVDYALISGRQRGLLVGAYGLINDIVHQIDGGVETDIVASGLRGVINSIKDVVGEIPNQSVLDEIFGEFCIGK